MTQPLDIAVVGYGIAGAAAAVLLRRQGHRVEVFERSDRDAPAGAGILLHPPALGLLARVGILESALALGARVSGIVGETIKGRRLMSFCYETRARGDSGLGIQRQALLELLRSSDRSQGSVHFGRAVGRADATGGLLWLEDGTRCGPYDLVVAADGANSTLRRSVPGIVAKDRLYRSAALVCLVDDPEGMVGAAVRQRFAGTRHVSAWPVGSRDVSLPRRASVSVNVPLADAARWMANDAWLRVVSGIWPELAELFRATATNRPRPVVYSYRDVVLRAFGCGRVVLLGDAAHAMSPQLGMGASLALDDAISFAATLALYPAPRDAMKVLEEERRSTVAACQRACRWLTPGFQSESRMLAAARDWLAAPLFKLSIPMWQAGFSLTRAR
jgi:2-polyprenyl-6-methoxyphenol hydroxylase-like FAD-dependent oxidoreductase